MSFPSPYFFFPVSMYLIKDFILHPEKAERNSKKGVRNNYFGYLKTQLSTSWVMYYHK